MSNAKESRRNLNIILDEACTYAARAKVMIGTEAEDGPLKMERLIKAEAARVSAMAALIEAEAVIVQLKDEMIGKADSETAVEGALDKMLASGDLDLDDEPLGTEAAPYASKPAVVLGQGTSRTEWPR